MAKVTLDMSSFKALASDARLNILKSLDGKKMNLKEISKSTDLNKATLHEHLTKLSEADLVKRIERKGHKWVYYKLTWKGEGLLHPENTRIVVLFSLTFMALAGAIIQFIRYLTTRVSSTISPGLSNDLLLNEEVKEKFGYAINGGNLSYAESGQSDCLVKEGMRSVNDSLFPFLKEGISKNWSQGTNESLNITTSNVDGGTSFAAEQASNFTNDPILLYLSIACFVIFVSILCISIWRYNKNKTPKL